MMQDEEILKIIRTVVEYGWPWLYQDYLNGEWTWESGTVLTVKTDRKLDVLLKQLANGVPVRLDPTPVWGWPIEKREGMPVWSREYQKWPDHEEYGRWEKKYSPPKMKPFSEGGYSIETQNVSIHPLNPNEPPPSDWSPVGRRVLE